MKYRVLGRTRLRVSEIGFGGHEYRRPLPTTLGRWGETDTRKFMKKQPERNELIQRAVELGVNYFDATQPEEAKSLGIALKEAEAREDVFVALMILRPLSRIAGKPRSDWERIITGDVKEKLGLLQSSYADVLNVHLPEAGYSKERLTVTIETLRGLREEGAIRWISASSHRPRFLAELMRAYDCFDSVMVRYNYHLREARDVVFPLCKAMEVGVAVMKPIAWPYYGIPFTCFGPLGNEAVRCKPVQNSIRWILDSEEVSTVVPGMNSHEELIGNVEAVIRDEEIDEEQLKLYLEMAQGPRARGKLEKMLSDPSVDIRHFAQRAPKELSP